MIDEEVSLSCLFLIGHSVGTPRSESSGIGC